MASCLLLPHHPQARGLEKAFSGLLPSIKVADVARCLVLDAESTPVAAAGAGGSVAVFEMAALKKAAQSGTPPQA